MDLCLQLCVSKVLLKKVLTISLILKSILVKLFTGFSTDGEFNSLRTKGSTRPVSVVQLKADARSEARSTSVRQIERFLFPIVGKFFPFFMVDSRL